jgi:hypothetical protein
MQRGRAAIDGRKTLCNIAIVGVELSLATILYSFVSNIEQTM